MQLQSQESRDPKLWFAFSPQVLVIKSSHPIVVSGTCLICTLLLQPGVITTTHTLLLVPPTSSHRSPARWTRTLWQLWPPCPPLATGTSCLFFPSRLQRRHVKPRLKTLRKESEGQGLGANGSRCWKRYTVLYYWTSRYKCGYWLQCSRKVKVYKVKSRAVGGGGSMSWVFMLWLKVTSPRLWINCHFIVLLFPPLPPLKAAALDLCEISATLTFTARLMK